MTWGMQAALRVSHRCSDSSCHLKTNVVSVRNLKQAALMSFLASWSHNLVFREIHLFSAERLRIQDIGGCDSTKDDILGNRQVAAF